MSKAKRPKHHKYTPQQISSVNVRNGDNIALQILKIEIVFGGVIEPYELTVVVIEEENFIFSGLLPCYLTADNGECGYGAVHCFACPDSACVIIKRQGADPALTHFFKLATALPTQRSIRRTLWDCPKRYIGRAEGLLLYVY